MNQGGEPGHDDYGLPPVDVAVPDDARELYRDVQAYHRELRAVRRHERSRRLRAPLHSSGAMMPLIAGCLVLALFAGMVLTMFSANSYISGLEGQRRASAPAGTGGSISPKGAPARAAQPSGHQSGFPAAGASGSTGLGPAAAGSAAARLPGRTIKVSGAPVALSRLTSAILAVIPLNCGCAMTVRQLVAQASRAGVSVYLIGSRSTAAELMKLARTSAPGSAKIGIDADNVLTDKYRLSGGLAVLLVDSRGVVTVDKSQRLGPQLRAEIQTLQPTG